MNQIFFIIGCILIVVSLVYYGRFQRLCGRIADFTHGRPERLSRVETFWGIRPLRTRRILRSLAQTEPDPALRSGATKALRYWRQTYLFGLPGLILAILAFYLMTLSRTM